MNFKSSTVYVYTYVSVLYQFESRHEGNIVTKLRKFWVCATTKKTTIPQKGSKFQTSITQSLVPIYARRVVKS